MRALSHDLRNPLTAIKVHASVEVESREGVGRTFSVRLLLVTGPDHPGPAAVDSAAIPPDGPSVGESLRLG